MDLHVHDVWMKGNLVLREFVGLLHETPRDRDWGARFSQQLAPQLLDSVTDPNS